MTKYMLLRDIEREIEILLIADTWKACYERMATDFEAATDLSRNVGVDKKNGDYGFNVTCAWYNDLHGQNHDWSIHKIVDDKEAYYTNEELLSFKRSLIN